MDIQWLGLALSALLLIIPIVVSRYKKLDLVKPLLKAITRMVVQLAMIGLVLEYLFKWNTPVSTFGWMLIMIGAAVHTIISRLDIKWRFMLPVVIFPLLASTLVVMPFVIFVIVRPQPFLDARFIIPIYGMVLGNSMNSTALALERFHSDIKSSWKEYYTYIAMGASPREATFSFCQKAIKMSLMPRIMNVSSMGIIALPGMMSGQILSGASPATAIKYQIMIMIAIIAAVTLTVFLSLRLFTARMFDRDYLPLPEVLDPEDRD